MSAIGKSSSRLLFKFATAVQTLGPVQIEKHLDGLISSKDILAHKSSPTTYRIECVIKIVSKALNLSQDELKIGNSVDANFGRSFVYFLIKTKAAPALSQKEISKCLNRNTHSVVNRAMKKINGLNPENKFDKPWYDQLKEIEKLVEDRLKSISIQTDKISKNGR